jgi:hypothetical protein
MRIITGTIALLLCAAAPTAAAVQNGNQVIEDFDALTNSWGGAITLILSAHVSGGTIQTKAVDLDPAFPPFSDSNVLFGRSITVQLDDPFNDSYPAFGAFVTGGDVVTLDVYAYDYALATEVLYGSTATPGANIVGSALPPNIYLAFANPPGGALLTRAVFHSAQDFAIDNLALGLPDGPVGIPEPASWTLLIAGFGAVGTQLRRRMPTAAARGAGRRRG